jgi:D-alanyl-lipoteichoic acid acyltransferase DltB (MBOAT superfamily)
MLFNTPEYLGFFLVVLAVSWLAAGFTRFRTWFILAASFYFYTSNNHWQVLLLLATTTIDYAICLRLGTTEDGRTRKLLVGISIVSNLGMLGYFKYANFFAENVRAFATLIGWHLDWFDVNVLLPVGISFYTFEALSYTIDVYRRKIPVEKEWTRLAFLVSFFPHLIAGPIVRAADFFPQIGKRPRIKVPELEMALLLVFGGLIKKIVFADALGPYADKAFDSPEKLDSFEAWLGVYAFMFQIYFDFSGYTDIALGCAKLLGYDLPQNFRRPYAAISFTDFWHRWHISLSTWLRDYLYISLGGNRTKTRWGTYRNLLITMFLGGLWHGAAWHFAIWGFVHGVLLSLEKAFGAGRSHEGVRLTLFARLLLNIAFIQVLLVTWILFRANDLGKLRTLFEAMFRFQMEYPITLGMVMCVALMVCAWLWQLVNEAVPLRQYWVKYTPLAFKAGAYATAFAIVVLLNNPNPRAFIYFQF